MEQEYSRMIELKLKPKPKPKPVVKLADLYTAQPYPLKAP
jgi:hypothetical protein